VTELHRLRQLRDEMSVVQRAHSVQARNKDLAAESDQLRHLLEEAPGFVAVLEGKDHTFRMANKAYRQLVGQRDIVGKPLEEALPEVVEQGFTDLLRQVQDSGKPFVARGKKVLLRNGPTGQMEVLYLDFIYQPILNEEGLVSGVFVQGHDVTDQVEAEQHQKLLIDELNHRVKNTLAIVCGLAAQSFRKNSGSLDGLMIFNARLAALAAAHSLLTEVSWEAADLAGVIQAGIGAVTGIDLERLTISGPAVSIAPQVATSVTMVIHELSTNAVKYGALSGTSGRVDVTWAIDDQKSGRMLSLAWIESGGPAVVPPDRMGFGTRLIKRGFSSNVEASANIQFLPSGLCCRFVTFLQGDDA
jgi:two-component sensor histidine kinase